MGEKLPPTEMKLYRHVDEVLHYLWDPIGVAGSVQARDEYYSYLPKVFALVRDKRPAKDIADYLVMIERDRMGMDANRSRADEIANTLLDDWAWILEREFE